MRKNIEIERLRAVAILMVIVSHATFIHSFLPEYFRSPWTGVDLFFVISGYVVSLSFLRILPDLTACTSFAHRVSVSLEALQTFYLRRIFRILPAAITWILIYWLLAWIYHSRAAYLFGTPERLAKEAIYFFSGFYNYLKYQGDGDVSYLGHYWSLTVEEHFYLLVPWVFIAFARRQQRLLALLAGIVLVIFVLRPFIPAPSGVMQLAFEKFASHRRFDALFMGVFLALAGRRKAAVPWWPTPEVASGPKRLGVVLRTGALRTLLVLFFLAMLCATPVVLPEQFKMNMGLTVYALASLGLVYLASLESGYVFEIPVLKQLLEYIGSRSYAIYLCHTAVAELHIQFTNDFGSMVPVWLRESRSGIVLQFLLMLVAMIALAELTYRLVEQPMISHGKRIIARRRAAADASPARVAEAVEA